MATNRQSRWSNLEELHQEDAFSEVEAGPLSSLPVLTAKLLVEVLVDSSDATTFQTNIDDVQLDLCYSISPKEVAEALHNLTTASQARRIRECFPSDSPGLTLFEICARAGRSEKMRALAAAATARLRNLILAGNAALPEVLRLLRAGAEPTRQNLSCFVNEQGDAKRARIEVGPNASPGARRLSCSGTPLHWVCHAASRVPHSCRSHYVEITRCAMDHSSMVVKLQYPCNAPVVELCFSGLTVATLYTPCRSVIHLILQYIDRNEMLCKVKCNWYSKDN
ncbi:IRX7 [Symbiodinium sp. CCMP2456]|nr:IRX7 [Symbiodinium sp. CCMP2456]